MVNKPDPVRRRLTNAGLSVEDCDKYTAILRSFLSARLTKVKFEAEMLKVIPREKIHIHNAVIRELLARAQQRREGVPDLPVVSLIAEKAVSRPSRDSNRPAAPRPTSDRPNASRKRPREREGEEADVRTGPPSAVGRAPPDSATADAPSGRRGAVGPEKTEKPSRTVRQPPNGARVGAVGSGIGSRPSSSPLITGTDISTYNVLPFFPVRPGLALDLDLFLKVRHRMRDQAIDMMGMTAVKDDAVSLMVLALETHVKSLMEAGARQRTARQVMRPHGNLQCGPVRGRDIRDAALRNTSFLGDEAGLDLERLSLLLF